jgi:YidC/Oxa1 family membrane protein insertase
VSEKPRKELTANQRLILAFGLWLLFMFAWSALYRPAVPPQPAPTAPATTKAPPPGAPAAAAVSAAPTATAAKPLTAVAAEQEQNLVIENGLYRVEFSNRGAVVRSWRLKNYQDHERKPLELVSADGAQQVGAWPFSFVLADAQIEAQLNSALYRATPADAERRAPAEILFEWSDGRLSATKKVRMDSSYVVELETSVLLEGKPLAHAVAWRGGFGDVTELAHAEQVKVFYQRDGELETLEHKKLGASDNPAQRLRQEGTLRYAGIEDHYFAAAFLPRGLRPEELGAGLALWHWRSEREVKSGEKTLKEPVAEMAAGSTVEGPLAVRVFVGPKALDELRALKPPLTELVKFGWFSIISEPLFYFLKWIHKYVPNYGWAIVLMTLAINMALFPLKVSSWRSMQRMQKVMPEVKQIQERYKKYSLTDPRRQQMNEEVMKVYKREGINPMGSCWPMLIQMPIWIALYQMLGAAIELRHAPWVLWVKDLSARDPYYILPVLMALTMYISQKMTPATSADPAQQRMMQMMPIIFGGMFVIFPVSSGLVLYILTSNIIAMGQQWYLNRTSPAPAGRGAKGKKQPA